MKKQSSFRIAEETKELTVEHDNSIRNGFGAIWQYIPPTYTKESIAINFNPNDLGDLFIELGQNLKLETNNIKNIEVENQIIPSVNGMFKEYQILLNYETVEDKQKKIASQYDTHKKIEYYKVKIRELENELREVKK